MKRRGRSRSDPLNYYESPKLRRALVVNLISATEKSVWSASISSRIPTVILVVIDHQINYNWYNEPSAVSPFKSLKLRHAWLSLWDKHMTTGRINQIDIYFVSECETHTQKCSPTPTLKSAALCHWCSRIHNSNSKIWVCFDELDSSQND